MFEIKVNRNIVSAQETEPLTSGSVSVYRCHFSFDATWDGFFRSAVFRVGSKSITVPLGADDTCDLPWELLVKENIGLAVEVSVYGVKDETEIQPTIWDKLGRIRRGSEPGEDAKEFSPSVYDRIVSLVKVYSDKTKGDKGDKGDPGDGDMNTSTYDPQGRAEDIFAYVDNSVGAIPELTVENVSGLQDALDKKLNASSKPAGAYKGTGDATQQVIDTKGTGKGVLIYGGVLGAIVTPNGAVCWSTANGTVATLPHTEVAFANGKLTIATASFYVNSGTTSYAYQVF